MTSSSLRSSLPSSVLSLLDTAEQKRKKTENDRALARRLHDAVHNSPVSISKLNVYVHDGAVSLYGTIRDESVRNDLLQIVAAQPGLARVVDHLRLSDA